jgi:hypothetical protein
MMTWAIGFSRSWRYLLPVAFVLIGIAVLMGLFETHAAPAWVFLIGLVVLIAGIASVGTRAFLKARGAFEAVVNRDDPQ